MSERKAFRIAAISELGGNGLATGISVVIPKGATFEEAKRSAADYVAQEMERYFLDECLRGIGMTP